MLDKLWALVIDLPDRSFRAATLLCLFGLGFASGYFSHRTVTLETRVVELEKQLAIDHERRNMVEWQLEELWKHDNYPGSK